jgi:hypothetical protein
MCKHVDPSEVAIGNIRAAAAAVDEDGGPEPEPEPEPEGTGRRSLQSDGDGVASTLVSIYPRVPHGIEFSPLSVQQLRTLPDASKRQVERLTIRKAGCFSIAFDGATDVSKMDLTAQVDWERNGAYCESVTLYPNPAFKPRVGTELNKNATITLNYERHLDTMDVLAQLEGDGVMQDPAYDAASGLLSFKVSHFSTYGVGGGSQRRMQDSVDVEFDFKLSTTNPADAPGILNDLNEQLKDPDAAIFKGNTTGALVVGQTAEVELKCPPGAYREEGASTCETCPVGYEPNDDSTGCNNCKLHDIEDGRAWASDGTRCHPCSPGTAPDEMRGACLVCANRQFSPHGTKCTRCIVSQMPNADKTGCICDVGYYNATSGHAKCYAASASFSPLDFPMPEVDGVVITEDECLTCDPTCLDCKYGHASLKEGFAVAMAKVEMKDPLHLIAGHRAVFECPLASACNVSYARVDGDTGLNGTGWAQCASAYTGPLCALCSRGWSRKGFHGVCKPCGPAANITFSLMLLVGLGGYVGFMVGAYVLIALDTGSNVDDDGVAFEKRSRVKKYVKRIITLSKILIGLYQILGQLEVSMDLKYPESFQWFVSAIKALSMDLVSMLDMGCAVDKFTFYGKFLFAAGLPLLLGSGCFMVYHVEMKRLRRKTDVDDGAGAITARNIAIQMGLFVTFLVYPFVSQTVFSGFQCRQLGDHEAWLGVDYQISCNTVGHVLYIAVATMAVAAYPIGIPLGTLFLLVRNRKEMHVVNSPARLRYAFLVADYKPAYFYWEILEMLRKVILTGLLIFLSRGSMVQVIVAIVVTFGFMIATARNMPYENDNANRFKLATESALILTLIFTMLLKADLSTEDIDPFSIGIVMLAVNTVVPAVTLFISTAVDVRNELKDLLAKDGEQSDYEGDADGASQEWEDDATFDNPVHGGESQDFQD